MSNEDLTTFITNYLLNDRTQRAIMLTAPWGTGKSFYLNNTLLPHLNRADLLTDSPDNKTVKKDKQTKKNKIEKRCIVVSLYGLETINELSKALYIESKAPLSLKKKKCKMLRAFSKPIVSGAISIGKTVLKQLTKIDIDFSVSNPDWQKLYDSVDYSNKLIILENLERSGIDIIKILGYVNNLVEEDGVKVLLVANEDELIKYEQSVDISEETDELAESLDKTSAPQKREYTETTKQYLAKKEKTISDTIRFTSDTESAVESILKSFKDQTLDGLLLKDGKENAGIVADILHIMEIKKCWNLRSVIYGCQKAVDIYKRIKSEIEDDGFFKLILCGTIAFSLILKNDDSIIWDEQDSVASTKLGTNDYPLLYATYRYIKEHIIKNEEFVEAYKRYRQTIEAEKANECLQVIYSFSITPQETVETELSKLIDNLEKNRIPYSEFEKLASHLVALRNIIGCDEKIKRCHDLMIKQLEKAEIEDEKEISSFFYFELKTKEEQEEYRKWKEEMQNVLKAKGRNRFAFDYSPKSIESFYSHTYSDSSKYLEKQCFAKLFDINKLLCFLKEAAPQEIYLLRGCFANVYHFSSLGEFFSEDKEALIQIKNKADSLIHAENSEIKDGIARYQIGIFSKDINSYIEKM